MNGKYMNEDSYEKRDEERKRLKKEMEDTKLINILIKCKKDLLLLDREEILEEIGTNGERVKDLKVKERVLKDELIEIDNALIQYNEEGEKENA